MATATQLPMGLEVGHFLEAGAVVSVSEFAGRLRVKLPTIFVFVCKEQSTWDLGGELSIKMRK
jgi:hypothetical protein